MFSPADAHIVICDPERLPGPEAVVRVADCTRMIVKALREGKHHAFLLQVRLKDNARAARPGVWPAAAHLADLELQLAVPTTVYQWLQAFHDLRWRGKPDHQIGSTHWQAWLLADAQCDAALSLGTRPQHKPSMRRPGAARWRHTRFHWPTCPSSQRQRAPSGSRCRPPWREGPLKQLNAPCVQTSTTQAGQCWNTWRGTQCTLQPRSMTRRRRPTSSKGGHRGLHGTPRTHGAPRRRRPTMQTAMRRHPERPRGPAVRPNKGPSLRGWPPWPPCPPHWERTLRIPWPRRTRETWLPQRTHRRCRCGTADSRRTRRTRPNGSSRGTCATASSRQTGPSGTRSGGAGGRRPVPTTSTSSPACYPRITIMLQETGIATRAQEMHVAAALRDKGYTPFFSSASARLAETGATSTSRGGGLLTAVSSKYVAEHEVFSFTEIVPGKAAALEIRTDGGGLTLINVHGPQAGCSPWAGRAAFWADIQMYATARSLGERHPVVIAGDTNVYMDATSNPATEHFHAGWEACGFRRATAGGEEDMTPTLHPSWHRVDTFLVNEPLLPGSLRESVWALGMAYPQVIGSDHLPVRLALLGLLNTAGRAAMPSPYSHTEGHLLCTTPRPRPSNTACGWRSPPRRMNPPWRPGWVPQSSTLTGPCPRPRWTRCSNTSTRRMTP